MKTNALILTAFLATLVAIALLPIGAAAAGIALTVTGFLPVFLADYGRTVQPLRVSAEVVPFQPAPGASLAAAA